MRQHSGSSTPAPLLLAMGLTLAMVLTGCSPRETGRARYLLGPAYQRDNVWYYPRENYSGVQTGLAAVAASRHPATTANGEFYDPTALAAGHPTLQLPAIARVTNLENGLAVILRINDRGPDRPHRLLELTPRAASLLGIPATGGTQIRVDILETESRTAVEDLASTPRLDIDTAPRGVVRQEGASQPPSPALAEAPPAQVRLHRMPNTLMQTSFTPGALFIRLGSFGRAEFAERQRARLAHLAPTLETEREGRQMTYRLSIGPLHNIAAADATLDQVFHAGITDGRIVVVHATTQ